MGRVRFFQRLCRYNQKVLALYVQRAQRMRPAEVARDRGIGMLSIQRTLIHIIRVHEAWNLYIARGDEAGLHRSHEAFAELMKKGTPMAEVERYFQRVFKEIDRRARTMSERELDRVVKAPWMPGRYTVEDMLMQTTLEQAHHLGEVIGACWQDDRASPQMMWIPTLLGKKVSVR
jgi:uncharacterized damage-inducible protein DinB